MKTLFRLGIRAFNRAISVSRFELIRHPKKPFGLELYPDTDRTETPRYVNIGAGNFYHPLWHNLDMPNDYYAGQQKDKLHISHDLTSSQHLPFADQTLHVAYTSHVVEHLSNDDVAHLFAEVYRCLRPGGVFRITCPDMDLEYDAYLRRDNSFWKWPNAYKVFNSSVEQCFLDHFATILTLSHPEKGCRKFSDQEVGSLFADMGKVGAFEYLINQIPGNLRSRYPADHVNWFNFEKLLTMLGDAGFAKVYESKYGQSKSPLLRNLALFDSTCPELSLYVECVK